MSHRARRRRFVSMLGGWFAALFPMAFCPAQVELGDVTNGGNGFGSAPPDVTGLNEATGEFVTGLTADVRRAEGDPDPAPVASPFVDSVFILGPTDGGDPYTRPITRSGVTFDFPATDASGQGWNFILGNRFPGDNQLPGAPCRAGGQDFATGVGIHASSGITYDLAAVRAEYGELTEFSTFWGMSSCASGDVDLYAILSSDDGVITTETFLGVTVDQGQDLVMTIPPEATYLTLAVGSNGGIACDSASFGRAVLGLVQPPAAPIGLGDVTNGGDGSGTAPPDNTGINEATGAFVTELAGGVTLAEGDPDPAPVDSPYVDSVFILGPAEGETYSRAITQSGITFEFPASDAANTGWNYILGNRTPGNNVLPGAPCIAGGREFATGVGIHASSGITYDLDALRERHGAENINYLGAYWGMSACDGGDVNLYAIFSNDADGVLKTETLEGVTVNMGESLVTEVPAAASYVTFAVGARGGIACDSPSFGGAVLLKEPPAIQQLLVRPPAASLLTGQTTQLRVEGLDPLGLLSDDLTSAASGTTYGAEPAGIVDVGEDGLVTALAPGTAVVTAANGDLSADATVTVETVVHLVATPETVALTPGGTRQLSVRGTNENGSLSIDVTAAAAGTSYSAAPAGIVAVDADGLVEGLATGDATITVTNGDLSATVPATVIEPFINLSDITAGGTGAGNAPPDHIGIDIRNGNFGTVPILGGVAETDPDADGVNPSPVADSPFVDSVFFIGPAEPDADSHRQGISSSGVTFEFPLGDAVGTGWNHILADGNGTGGDWGATRGPIDIGGEIFTTSVGIHAAAGITYDLDALRAEHGAENVRHFASFMGVVNCDCARLNLYAILSNRFVGVVGMAKLEDLLANQGSFVQLQIPANANYLTLATGSNDGELCCDQGHFAAAVLLGSPPAIEGLTLSPEEALLAVGDDLQLVAGGLRRIGFDSISGDISSAADGTTYTTEPEGIVTVDADGLLTAVAAGEATVTAHNGDASASMTVTVLTSLLNLADVTAGGDGTGTAPAGNVGIDQRNGSFVTGPADPRGVSEADAAGDGLDPSPVADSEFVDSVFILGPTPEGADVASQVINQDGVSVDFPAGDAIGSAWNFILRSPNGTGGAWGSAPGTGPVLVGAETATSGVGIHSAAGITYDLEALRATHGASAVGSFETLWGLPQCDCGLITLYAILSDATSVVAMESRDFGPGESDRLAMSIPAEATFLTLVTGARDGTNCCDQGTFAEALIFPTQTAQIAGDCNQDGVVDVSDLSCYVALQFSGFHLVGARTEGPCGGDDLSSAGNVTVLDVDGSASVDPNDIVYLAQFLYAGGLPPSQGAGCFVIAEGDCQASLGCE